MTITLTAWVIPVVILLVGLVVASNYYRTGKNAYSGGFLGDSWTAMIAFGIFMIFAIAALGLAAGLLIG